MIRLAFRLDDVSESSDQAIEKRILELLSKNNLVACFAVEPFTNSTNGSCPLASKKVWHLIDASEKGVVEIAMHGFTHTKRKILPNGNYSEFAGLNETEQLDLIQRGVEHLQDLFGKSIHGFVPPWNSYDQTILQVLERCGFRYMSAGWESLQQYSSRLPILPCTCNLSYVKDAVTEARKFIRLSPTIVVIMHHYDFSETDDSRAITNIEKFENLLKWIKLQEDIKVESLSNIAETLTANQCLRTLRSQNWKKRLHWRVQHLFPKYCFITKPLFRVLFEVVRGIRKNSFVLES